MKLSLFTGAHIGISHVGLKICFCRKNVLVTHSDMLTGVSYFTQSSSWIFENVTAEKTVSKVASTNTKSATTASVFLLFWFSLLFLFSHKRLPELFRNI